MTFDMFDVVKSSDNFYGHITQVIKGEVVDDTILVENQYVVTSEDGDVAYYWESKIDDWFEEFWVAETDTDGDIGRFVLETINPYKVVEFLKQSKTPPVRYHVSDSRTGDGQNGQDWLEGQLAGEF